MAIDINRNEPKDRFYDLDYLRGLAALSVVLFHFTFGYDNGLGKIYEDKFYFRYGNFGVYLFFMISGYVIFMTLNKIKHPSEFLLSRFSRLYPAYWTAIFISIIFVNLFSNPFGYEDVTIKQLLINLTMFQRWLKVKDIDGAYWTLSVELTFYIIMFMLYLFKQLKNIYVVCLIWLLFSLGNYCSNLYFKNYLNFVLILNHIPLFISGIMFYKLKAGEKSLITHIIILLSLVIESFYVFEIYKNFDVLFIILFFYVLFYALVYLKRRRSKPIFILNFFGTISYSLYLIHENIGLTIIYNLKKNINSDLLIVGIALIIVISIATLMTFFVEKPVMKLIRSKFK